MPLAPLAIEILQSVPRFMNSDLVFTTSGQTPISGFGRHKARLDVEVGASDWRFHDIRRTVATNMAMMRVPPHIIEAILNHKTGIVSGVAAIYNRHAYLDEKREALEQWAEQMRAMVAQAPSRRNASWHHIRQWFRSIPVYRYRTAQLARGDAGSRRVTFAGDFETDRLQHCQRGFQRWIAVLAKRLVELFPR